MADEAKPIEQPASAAPPVAEAPQAHVPDSPPAAAPAVANAEPAAAPAETAAPAATEPAPTLLQQFDKDNAAKPAEGEKPAAEAAADGKPGEKPAEPAKPAEPKPGEAKPAEAKPGEKPAEAKAEAPKLEPVAYEYALPETIKMDDALKGEFHTALDAFRADPAKGVQPLIALHEKTMSDYATHLQNEQVRVWNDTRKGWNTDALADEQIGGSGHQTAMGAIARMRDLFVSEKDRPAFEQFLQVTGAGDHPAFLKMLHNAARLYDEPAMPPSNVKPPATNGQNPNGRRGIMYDHPRSNSNRQQ